MSNSTISSMMANFSARLFQVTTEAPTFTVEPNTEYNGTLFADWPNLKSSNYTNWSIILTVVLVGLVGNALAFILMSGGQLSFLSYPVYLKWLAISDSTLLIFKLIDETEKTYALYHFVHYSDVICKLYRYVRYTVFMLSPWLVVGFTMDRFVCVIFPLTRDRFCTRKKAIVVCSVLTVVTSLVVVPIPVNVRIIDGLCRSPIDVYYAFMVIRLVLTSALPCLVIFFLNAAIILRIHRSATFRKSFASRPNSSSSQDKSTRPLVLVSVFAFITLLPLSVTECVEAFVDYFSNNTLDMSLAKDLWAIFNVIYLMNFGQNFYILIASSKKYRKIMAMKMNCFTRTTQSDSQATMASMTAITTSVNSNMQTIESVS